MGTKLRIKKHVFYSRKCSFHSSFELSVTQSALTTNEQLMKSRLPNVFGKTLTSITLPFTLFESHYWQVHCHPWQTKFIFNPLCVQRQDNEVYFCMNLYHPAHFAAIIVFIFFWDASAKRIFCWCTPSGMPRRQALSRSWSHPLFLECQDVLIFKNMAAKNAGCPKNMED